jgi:hypothetical protein
MKRNLLKVGSFLALAAVFALGLSSSAEASVALRLTQGATVVTVNDDGAGDLAALDPNTIVFFGPVGLFTLNVTTGIVSPDTVLPEIMHLNSIDTSLGAGTLTIEFTATDLDLQTLNMLLALGPLVAPGGSITYSAYYDEGNTAFAQTSLINTINGSGSASGPAPSTTPYSLTQVVTITHGAQGGTTSFDANISVPEPASMSLLGLGLAGIAALRRRRAARS